MITAPDFNKKQILFVLANEGEKLALANDNLVVKHSDGKIKFQCTCYRIFIVFVVGHCSITTPLIQAARKFGFFIVCMTPGFKTYAVIGAEKDGNTLLKKQQYAYTGDELAKFIVKNKIYNQISVLKSVRNKSDAVKCAINTLLGYSAKIAETETIHELMAYEGLASKVYFSNHFNNIQWNGRQPRIKRDMVNAVLDMGYTILFSFVDALLSCFGFDTYCGVLHKQFYMRKSLVCDIVEPFRVIIDKTIKKAINLKQITEEDFIVINNQYRLKWENSSKYAKILMLPLIEQKDEIFLYIQSYYRNFMKQESIDNYHSYEFEG